MQSIIRFNLVRVGLTSRPGIASLVIQSVKLTLRRRWAKPLKVSVINGGPQELAGLRGHAYKANYNLPQVFRRLHSIGKVSSTGCSPFKKKTQGPARVWMCPGDTEGSPCVSSCLLFKFTRMSGTVVFLLQMANGGETFPWKAIVQPVVQSCRTVLQGLGNADQRSTRLLAEWR